jgi:hypothetical protein
MSHAHLKSTRAEKKAALLAHAERLIDRLLDWSEAPTHPTMTQFEDQALALRQEFGQALAQTALTTQAETAEIALPACPHCGQPMRPKGWKEKTVVSRLGELQWERPYFYCPACRQGLFPPG